MLSFTGVVVGLYLLTAHLMLSKGQGFAYCMGAGVVLVASDRADTAWAAFAVCDSGGSHWLDAVDTAFDSDFVSVICNVNKMCRTGIK